MNRRNFLRTSLVTGSALSINGSLSTAKRGENKVKDHNYLVLPRKTVPVLGQYDVIVAGAGLGGVSAAVAATKAGAKTLLVERNGFAGGVATAGMCSSVYNCLYTPSHELVVRGNSAIFVERLAESAGYGKKWQDHRGHIIFDTERGKIVLDQLIRESGCDYLWDTVVTDVVMDKQRVTGLVIDGKSGKRAIKAKTVVDSTGDSDVAYMSGAPCRTKICKSSYNFRLANVDVNKFVQFFIDNPGTYPDYIDIDWTFKEVLEHYWQTGVFLFPHGGTIQLDAIQKGLKDGTYPSRFGKFTQLDAVQMHAIQSSGIVNFVGPCIEINPFDITEVSQTITQGRELAYVIADFYRNHIQGFDNCFIAGLADDLGVRASRWIEGEFEFTSHMKKQQTNFVDSIGKGIVEVHEQKNKSQRAWGVQVLYDKTYDIPFRCLLPQKIDGLIMGAGRSVSQSNPYLLRVMAMTMVIGQGAGIAAALSAKTDKRVRDIDIQLLQQELKDQNVNC